MQPQPAKVRVDRVSLSYPGRRADPPVHVLDDVSLTVGPSEFVCVVGPSGCGKTTLLNAIAGFVDPSAGDVLVDGRPIDGPGPERGMVFQQYGLFPWFTVEQNIQYGPRLRGAPRQELAAISRRYVDLVHLTGFERHYPSELSGGMQQRVAIARALANGPDILLLDEPFGALDALTREHMQEELLRIWEKERRTCIFITHSLGEAIFLADRVIVMTARPGRIKQDLPITLPRPRARTADAFFALYRQLDEVLREEVVRAKSQGGGHD